MRNYYPTITNAIDLKFQKQIPISVTISKTVSYFTNYIGTVLIALVLTKKLQSPVALEWFLQMSF